MARVVMVSGIRPASAAGARMGRRSTVNPLAGSPLVLGVVAVRELVCDARRDHERDRPTPRRQPGHLGDGSGAVREEHQRHL
nr:hypothetical protein [Saccharothrix variisporea]